jgi:hypothetical protein
MQTITLLKHVTLIISLIALLLTDLVKIGTALLVPLF